MNPELSFRCVTIGEVGDYNDIHHDFHELYGIERGGAVMVVLTVMSIGVRGMHLRSLDDLR